MALQHLRSSTLDKRPVPGSMSDGQLAINTNLASPGLFFKDSNGDLVKVGPVHVGTTAPNVSPAVGGQAGNSKGEFWLDTTGGGYVLKVYDGTSWRTADGSYVNVTGDTMTGNLTLDASSLIFDTGTFNTTVSATTATAARTITIPNITGTLVTTGDTGSVTSAMIADGTIADGDISASAEIAVSKLADGTARQLLQTDAAGTGVEWTSNVDIPGTLDVTSAATFDSTVTVVGDLTLNAQADLRFADADSSNWVAFQAPTTVATNITWTLPSADGSANQVLQTNGSGTLSWATPAAGGGDVLLASNNAFTGANTFTNATGQIFRSAATQDGILLRGRAGGTTSRTVEIIPTTLTASRVLTAPDVSGTIVTTGDTGSVTSSMIADGAIVNVDINASAAIAYSKLASMTAGSILLGNATSVPTVTALSGDVTVDSSGITAIGSGVIVNADINASAAIAYSKLASMTAGSVLLGNATNVPTVTALTGDVTVSSAGVTAIGSGVIVNADVNASAAIAYSKLASMTAGSVLLGNASNVPTVTALSGDVTVSNTGVTSIGTGVIVNADVSASAAIAGSKIAPNFGSQDVITTGSVQGSVKADTAVTTSGAATYTFTAVPSWAKRITILFSDLSCAGADAFGIRVGTSGGIVSTGYSGSVFRIQDAGTPGVNVFSTEFTMALAGGNAAASVYSGSLTLSNITGNTWVMGGTFSANTTSASARMGYLNGYIALAGALTQVQLVNTTSTFDAGTFNVLYEG